MLGILRFNSKGKLLSPILIAVIIGGCVRSPKFPDVVTPQMAKDSIIIQPEETGDVRALSLYEQRLVRVFEDEQRLEAYAARDDTDYSEVQRRFHTVARAYASLIADNPGELEPILLYGKLLNRYGDTMGAMEQFHHALRIDDRQGVIYQQLSVVYAEEGDFSTALAYALEAVDKDPQQSVYHYGIGELLHAYRFDFVADGLLTQEVLEQQMMSAFERAAELEPQSIALQFRFAEAYYDMWQPDFGKALQQWQFISELFEDRLSVAEKNAIWLHKARCLAELGEYEEAGALATAVEAPGFSETRDDLLDQIELLMEETRNVE